MSPKRTSSWPVGPNGLWPATNDARGIAATIARLQGLVPALIVLESTRDYEAALADALTAAQLPASVVNPRQVRDFIKATGQLAKPTAWMRTSWPSLPNECDPRLGCVPRP